LKAKAFEAHPVEQSKACKSAWRSSLGTDEQQKNGWTVQKINITQSHSQ
jgi:hypothetical protein